MTITEKEMEEPPLRGLEDIRAEFSQYIDDWFEPNSERYKFMRRVHAALQGHGVPGSSNINGEK